MTFYQLQEHIRIFKIGRLKKKRKLAPHKRKRQDKQIRLNRHNKSFRLMEVLYVKFCESEQQVPFEN